MNLKLYHFLWNFKETVRWEYLVFKVRVRNKMN